MWRSKNIKNRVTTDSVETVREAGWLKVIFFGTMQTKSRRLITRSGKKNVFSKFCNSGGYLGRWQIVKIHLEKMVWTGRNFFFKSIAAQRCLATFTTFWKEKPIFNENPETIRKLIANDISTFPILSNLENGRFMHFLLNSSHARFIQCCISSGKPFLTARTKKLQWCCIA